MTLQAYRAFIASRAVSAKRDGFEPRPINENAKRHQDAVLRFALDRGKSAAFLDCVTGDTLIETIEGPRRIDDLAAAGKPIVVMSRSADGDIRWSLATAPFRKGRGVMFKVTLASGEAIRATAGHRFLTPEGWTACGDLSVGRQLVCASAPHPTIQGRALQALPRDARRYSGTLEGSRDRCSSRSRRYGQQLLRAADTARGLAPSLTYALALDGCYLQTDGLAHRPERSPSRPTFSPPSMPGSTRRGWSAADAPGCQPLSSGSVSSGESSRISRLFLSASRPDRSWRERLQGLFQSSLGDLSLSVPSSVSSVVSIEELGEEYKYDMHVPGDECYLGNGIWCHNTGLGKSFIELEFARQCADETGKPSLILTPLAVAGQMIREGRKFGIDARQIRDQSEVGAGVMVANYERLAKLDPASFGAVA